MTTPSKSTELLCWASSGGSELAPAAVAMLLVLVSDSAEERLHPPP